MKKLMIAAAIVCAAAMSQAASVTWQTGKLWAPLDATDVSFATGCYGDKIGSESVMNIFLVDKDTFDAATADNIIKDYAGKTGIPSVVGDNGAFLASKDGYNAGDKVYALVLITTVGSEDGNPYYIANKTYNEITKVGDDPISPLNGQLDSKWGGNSSTFEGSGAEITQWAAAPEPTSGLLLLLGVAGLALRRRRA